MVSPRGFDSAEAAEAVRSSWTAGDTAGDDVGNVKPFRAADLSAAFPPRPLPLNTAATRTLVDGGASLASGAGADSAGGFGVAALLPSFR